MTSAATPAASVTPLPSNATTRDNALKEQHYQGKLLYTPESCSITAVCSWWFLQFACYDQDEKDT